MWLTPATEKTWRYLISKFQRYLLEFSLLFLIWLSLKNAIIWLKWRIMWRNLGTFSMNAHYPSFVWLWFVIFTAYSSVVFFLRLFEVMRRGRPRGMRGGPGRMPPYMRGPPGQKFVVSHSAFDPVLVSLWKYFLSSSSSSDVLKELLLTTWSHEIIYNTNNGIECSVGQ